MIFCYKIINHERILKPPSLGHCIYETTQQTN